MASELYDVAVIGGGIVGCAVFFELTRQGYHCILCESEPHIMCGASAGNSGMLQTGFDAPLNSLELACIQKCQLAIFDLLDRFHIPFEKSSAYVIAWTKEEEEKLSKLKQHSDLTGISNASLVSANDIYHAEPFLRSGAREGLYVPGETAVDSNILGVCYAHHAKRQKSKICTNCTVSGFRYKVLSTSHGPMKAKVAISCAGLNGDSVDALAGVQSFEIKPRKGQYCVFGRQAKGLLSSMIFPVPNERTKGAVLFRSVYGNVLMGPTAEETQSRARPLPDKSLHRQLAYKACNLLPELSSYPVVGSYVGVRPATQFKDYQIKSYPDKNWLSVGGIRSTGVSGSLGIAQYVNECLKADFDLEPSRGSVWEYEEMFWKPTSSNKSILIDDCTYNMAHPIFQFGHAEMKSNL